ncbi:CrcB family protein [Streptosporangium sp. NPDC023615]|uniref:fluoride efflux transporter FluC n=1 Tax=Streptosporangium sp. NPDC023615 TaxID=3154794 RepID=UPI00343E885C
MSEPPLRRPSPAAPADPPPGPSPAVPAGPVPAGPVPAGPAPRPAPVMPADCDVDLAVPAQREELSRAPWGTLGAISAGGAAGALARHGLTLAFPHPPDGLPWATFAINVSGCLLIGLLMVFVTETPGVHRLVRPFLGVGVLGGFTTFSAYVTDIERLVAEGVPWVALGYLFGTVAAAMAATWTGIAVARLALRLRSGRRVADAR